MNFKIIIFIIASILFANCALAQQAVQVQFQQEIPMRDGIKLSADIYKPSTMTSRLPSLFVLTPYTTDRVHKDAMFFAKKGYGVVVVDIRGRGNSEGKFEPFKHEGKDGYDVCNWIAGQPWCNGKIGMFGGSYLGMVQWLILKEFPPALKTIVPTASVGPGIDFPKGNNIYYTYNTQWLAFTYGKTSNPNIFTDVDYWNEIFRELFVRHVPYKVLDKISGINSDVFQEWLLHPSFDNFYQEILPDKDDYAKMNIPILVITGHFDDDQPGTMHYYRNFMNYASEEAVKNCYFICGPWNHSGTRRPKAEYVNMTFGEDAILDMNDLHLQWFDYTLRGDIKPRFLTRNVKSYEMGTNKWKNADKLEGLTVSKLKFYLHSKDASAQDPFHSGFLKPGKANDQMPDTYVYNPLDTTNASLKLQDQMIDFSWRDKIEAFYPEKLVYHSESLQSEISLTGFPELTVYISMDVPDTDFEAILYEIQPDGECIYLSSAIMRARYRNSLETPELVKPGEVNPYEFASFHFTSRKLKRFSRLRLVFGALNSPYFQKNYNSGKDVSFETKADAAIANVEIWHNAQYPSYLEIPIGR